MSESVSASIDKLAATHITFPQGHKIFNQEFADNWNTKSQELCAQFKELEGTDQRQSWLKDVFREIFELIYDQNTKGSPTMPQISRLLEDIVSSGTQDIKDSELLSMVGKVFVSVSQEYSDEDDNVVLALARITKSLHKEMFKFSRLSTKLMNQGQTVLLKHLLKKSKYELKKFNLLMECSTGYIQLVTLLWAAYYDPDRMNKVPYFIQEFQQLAGKYSLDPMRCLDVILDVSSEFITEGYEFMIRFLKISDYWPKTSPANNFDYQSLNQGGNAIASHLISLHLNQEDVGKDTAYLDMVCILIREGFVSFLPIWDNIKPNDETLSAFFENFDNELEAESMKGVTNPLAMADALTAADDNDGDEKMEDVNTDGKDSSAKAEEKKALEQKQEALEKENIKNSVLNGSKLEFLKRLLVHGVLMPAFYIFKTHPQCVYINDMLPRLIGRLFENMLDPLYQSLVFSGSQNLQSASLITTLDNGLLSKKTRLVSERKSHNPFPLLEMRTRFVFYYAEWCKDLGELHTVEELFTKSNEFFTILGPSLGKVPQLISKLCRIGVADIETAAADKKEETINKWIDYVRKFIFPAIPVLEVNPVITSEIYQLMKFFPFKRRYFLYNELITRTSQDLLLPKVGFNKAERSAKSILKSLSMDTIETESRKLANLVSTNPLATLVPVIKQIENYDKVSELVVITTKYFNSFACDVLQFIILLRLTHNRPAIQTDGVNQNTWVQRLSVYISGLAKDCPKMDITNILVFIVKTLHEGNMVAVSILRELITTVGGIRDLNEVNTTRLIMLNSGEPLKYEARKLIFDTRDDNRELALKLVNQLAKQKTISELILLLYNLNREANTQTLHYKILSTRCDEMNTLLWSFIELVKYCFTLEEFGDNVLPLEVLTNDFHLSTSWVFHIWRNYIDQKFREADPSSDVMLQNAVFEGVDYSYITKELFLTFWKLSLYDVQFDKALYDKKKAGLEEELSKSSSTKKKNEYSKQIKDILVSCISHQKTFNNTKRLISEQSQSWAKDLSNERIMSFFQYCIVPRVLFSPPDALFSSHFLLKSFDLKDLMKILGVFMSSRILSALLFCCTRSEAGNMGIFFSQLLGSLEEMRVSEDQEFLYQRELYECNSLLTEQIVELLFNRNYMSIRNGIEFMKHVSHVFPIIDTQILVACKALERILESEEREDIKLPSNALFGHLKARLKNSCKPEEFCEMTEDEKREKGKYVSELEEINHYESLLANEKKEIELRKQLEFNKKQRAEAEKAKELEEAKKAEKEAEKKEDARDKFKGIPSGPSGGKQAARPQSSTWPFGKVIRFMDEVCFHLGRNNLNRAADCISDPTENQTLKRLSKESMPIRDLRTGVFEVFERFFRSLVYNPNNADFARKLDEIKAAVKYVSNDTPRARGDMYSEATPTEPAKKPSRYNNEPPSGPSNDRDTKTDSHEGTPSGWNRPYDSRNRQALPPGPQRMDNKRSNTTPRPMNFPDRPSQPRSETPRNGNKVYSARDQGSSGNNNNNRMRPKHEAPPASDERLTKRYRADDGRNKMRSPQNDSRSKYNNNNNGKRGNTQGLPQGPKGSGEYVSRYQR
ncbi:ZYRO0G05830p [Zygosaccharomyces rouxii]|uniref:THO complex subunit 2 n=1 Tax=Zygosaccharomyces rouxii (strain ATCC 2623 / CBS 732 / NBRC 1130 / NCYC 568 / NRRL Y-229) TaxID=559307 RepID=C5DZN3_ZYGRC|nr:uncharacterized protein ZYRO0G05830g [Zygosaccharomyces rouxii]KAH9202314.1 transcription factor/nuclear export subunit protein 2-domain-containing protein [Zygosaccharomyces rouxii]CAR29317.1 ZYRO0G05830p [Zygosaccharomyces rouxii]